MHVWMDPDPYIEGLEEVQKRIEGMINKRKQGSEQSPEPDEEMEYSSEPDDETDNDDNLEGLIRSFTGQVHRTRVIIEAVEKNKCRGVDISDIRKQLQAQFDILATMSAVNNWTLHRFSETMQKEFVISGDDAPQWRILYNRLWAEWVKHHK